MASEEVAEEEVASQNVYGANRTLFEQGSTRRTIARDNSGWM